ncbi:MAG TPA: 1-(5-phosphoribosyl)-5-[(5-phosphoribosylamino)methylideneamino]imidazole-4-carboxamide isomerase [Thermodesulfobacteriota bacterium]|nr:1-(5-phosphoribosyl)-5-[(5-phosphoribosylamino)methylideneamino]imidazole-4-carboxamide isomerase [Deltaproteobacteria bacterium]HNR11898.1 1-(5-phosphoribosyl)-5-[(5-phosphoribosylamino)methylideneamino]imidazole-4-carboxamide isomerase [Thermodesulfobacteriota bacterium]HNU70421.1 1-(5-phosphoribosyl)-5-[(5-phosphoribosylamino)methylideneamino]imidazole-4-carboxamide isomerase [Thermodesulfobacteriota bacterium]HOC38122.1 1-(5-phosphoribosyl)-5-[(5-phosphoribosylamino)methylideneamino]imida
MLIIPAIDLKNGNCVRLEQGLMERETVFSSHPSEMAQKWENLGAGMLHLVDLDGAFSGNPQNREAIASIRQAIRIPIELGGGIRDLDTIEAYVLLGINRVILGTVAYQNPDFVKAACSAFPGHIAVGIDARNGMVAVKGWAEQTDQRALDLAQRLEQAGVAAIIYTDISRDGMLTGVNVKATQELARTISVPVIASGGVASLDDILRLLPLAKDRVQGVIIGRALYAGTIRLEEALQLAGEGK